LGGANRLTTVVVHVLAMYEVLFGTCSGPLPLCPELVACQIINLASLDINRCSHPSLDVSTMHDSPACTHILGEQNGSVDFSPRPLEDTYNPEYEWPVVTPEVDSRQHSEYGSVVSDIENNSPLIFRLVVLSSSILPKIQTLAIIDNAYKLLELGRDTAPPTSETPRVRLKEMEISKLHATIFWSVEHAQWKVVDMGSKHGTFVQPPDWQPPQVNSGISLHDMDERGHRLSPPRVASLPQSLIHLSRLALGGTIFEVHIHADLPCDACSMGTDERMRVPLFSSKKKGTETSSSLSETNVSSGKRKRANQDTPMASLDARASLKQLKTTLLARTQSYKTDEEVLSSNTYIDRSARRRALNPLSSTDIPGVASRSSIIPPLTTGGVSAISVPRPESAPPISTPISQTNIGHRLLLQQGWVPGMSLGVSEGETIEDSQGAGPDARTRLVTPLEVTTNVGRSGIGSSAPSFEPGTSDWRAAGKQRRWDTLRKKPE
jgi:hypothetical protein